MIKPKHNLEVLNEVLSKQDFSSGSWTLSIVVILTFIFYHIAALAISIFNTFYRVVEGMITIIECPKQELGIDEQYLGTPGKYHCSVLSHFC